MSGTSLASLYFWLYAKYSQTFSRTTPLRSVSNRMKEERHGLGGGGLLQVLETNSIRLGFDEVIYREIRKQVANQFA